MRDGVARQREGKLVIPKLYLQDAEVDAEELPALKKQAQKCGYQFAASPGKSPTPLARDFYDFSWNHDSSVARLLDREPRVRRAVRGFKRRLLGG